MLPLLFEGTPLEVRSYTVMTLLGLAAGLAWIAREDRRRREGGRLVMLAFEAFLVGLVATRVFFVVQNWDRLYAGKPWLEVLRPRAGLVWYGGPLVAFPYSLWRIRRAGLEVFRVVDVLVQGLVLGHGLGRIGCLLHGCCFGRVCPRESWYSVVPAASPTGPALFPVQLVEALGCFGIFLALACLRQRLAERPGALTSLYFALYACARFALEMARGDEVRGFLARGLPLVGDLSTSQAISLAILVPAGAGLWWTALRPRPGPGSASGPAAAG